MGELERAEFALLAGLIFGAQRGQVVQRRFRFRRVGRLGGQTLNGEMALAVLNHDRRQAERAAVKIELDLRQVEGVEAEFEGASRHGGSTW